MKKRLMHRFDVVRISRIILTEPLYLTLVIALMMGISVMCLSWGVYKAQWGNFKMQMVGELHGKVLDVIVFSILFVMINRVIDGKRLIEHLKGEIDDLRFNDDVEDIKTRTYPIRSWHETEYVRLKIQKAIKALTRYHVNEIKLDHVNFSHGKFDQINLRKSNISRSIAHGVYLKSANLSETNICSSDFMDSDMDGIILTGTQANNTNFTGVSMVAADCTVGTYIHARFVNAELSKVKFKGSNLSGADFTGAKLYSTDFRLVRGLKVEQIIKARLRLNCKFDPALEKELAEYDSQFKNRAAVLLAFPTLSIKEIQMLG